MTEDLIKRKHELSEKVWNFNKRKAISEYNLVDKKPSSIFW